MNDDLARAWAEGAEAGWQASGEGHNGEYVHGVGTHDGRTSFAEANPNAVNPYEDKI